ncbi:MAG: ATP-binding protein, partial [Pseudomonadota bacterium]
AIGLISFAGVAQVLPALLGGIFWRGATRWGAAAGLLSGFFIWAYTLFLPSFGGSPIMSAQMLAAGPWGIEALRPQALFGLDGLDPLVHALIWSMTINTALFTILSVITFPTPLERLQGAQIVNAFERSGAGPGWVGGNADSEDLLVMAQRIIGAGDAQAMFQRAAEMQGQGGYMPDPTPEFVEMLERELSGWVGAATAHAMVAQITGGAAVSVQDLLAMADETAQMREYSNRLEVKSAELQHAARQLREANEKLTEISIQKDAFLSQISHELRTPMTSIRAFSEILRDARDLSRRDMRRYLSIIHDESLRLTRLLDDLLDLGVLENGQVALHIQEIGLRQVIERAIDATGLGDDGAGLKIRRSPAEEEVSVCTDGDRLSQVFINLIANARKYCMADQPELRIAVQDLGTWVSVDFIDNGAEISPKNQSVIFEKFARLSDEGTAGSTGLGLAICREVMTKLGGDISYLPGQGGAAFRVNLPVGGLRSGTGDSR